jgi:DNA polymerase III gamma/tau subunit
MLTVLDALLGEGHDLLHVWNELVGALRDLLLARVLPDRADLLARSPEETRQLASAAAALSREDLTRAFQILADVEFGLKGSAQPRFLFEAALIRLADLGAVRPLEEVLAALAPGAAPSRPVAEGPAQKKNEPVEPLNPSAAAAPLAATPTPLPAEKDLSSFRGHLRSLRPMTDAMLDAAKIHWDDEGIHVTFPAESDAVGRQMGRRETVELLERAARDAAGRKVAVLVSVAEGKPKAAAVEPAPAPARVAAQPALAEPAEPPSLLAVPELDEDKLLENARSEPGIAKLLKEFGAHVVEIRRLDAPGETEGSDSAAEERG